METTRTDVVVIGGGLAGLTAATVAARAGASVVLFDGRSIGGRARSVERHGFVLNEGGHALYRHAGGQAVLDALGIRVTGGPAPTEHAMTVWDGELVALPLTTKAVLSSSLLGVRSKLKLSALYPRLSAIAASAGDTSLAEWYEAEHVRPDLRRYLSTLLRLSTYSAEPERQTTRAMLGQLAAGGVRYLDGGWQSLVDQLAGTALAAGATITTHTTVQRVDRDGSLWHVRAGEQQVIADSLVFACGGPTLAVGLLGSDRADWVANAGPASRAACLDIGGPPGPHRFALSSDEPMYLSEHAPAARLAPPGMALTSLMRYLPADAHSDSVDNRAALERHAERCGLPGPGERAVERFLAAPVVSWGSPLAGLQRPSGFELAADGVFAAGDWVGDRLLADASITTGAAAGRAAAERVAVVS